jgi:hypothetical protein
MHLSDQYTRGWSIKAGLVPPSIALRPPSWQCPTCVQCMKVESMHAFRHVEVMLITHPLSAQ